MTTLMALSGAGLLMLGLILGRLSVRPRTARRSADTEGQRVSIGQADALALPQPVAGGPVAPPTPAREIAPRLSRDTVAGFAEWLEASRRLIAAEARVAQELAALPASEWLVDRQVNCPPRRVPFVLAGPTGVFTLWPTDGAWTMNDVGMVHHIGTDIGNRLTGYEGGVRSAIVLAFDSMTPRVWCRGDDAASAWIVGVDWLLGWLHSFSAGQGLNPDDVRAMQRLAGPVWKRRATARMPATPRHG